MSGKTFKEDEIGRRWDKCILNGLAKIGGGVLAGLVMSTILPLRKPLFILGVGAGFGMAYCSCERSVNEAFRDRIYEKLEQEKKASQKS